MTPFWRRLPKTLPEPILQPVIGVVEVWLDHDGHLELLRAERYPIKFKSADLNASLVTGTVTIPFTEAKMCDNLVLVFPGGQVPTKKVAGPWFICKGDHIELTITTHLAWETKHDRTPAPAQRRKVRRHRTA